MADPALIRELAGILASHCNSLVLEQRAKEERAHQIMMDRCGYDASATEVTDFSVEQAVPDGISDPELCQRLRESQRLDSVNYRYSERAAKNEMPQDCYYQAFPFHLGSRGKRLMYNMAEQPNTLMFQVLKIGELRTLILRDLLFLDKKNLALASKLTYKMCGGFYEVWDTNRANFLNNDCTMVQIGTLDNDQKSPVFIKGSRISFLVENGFPYNRLKETQKVRTLNYDVSRATSGTIFTCDTLMWPATPTLLNMSNYNSSTRSFEEEYRNLSRTQARHVMMTAIPPMPTGGNKKSRRLTYQCSFVHMLRGFEALVNVGKSIETLDIAGQTFLAQDYVDLLLSATPNLKQLTLRNNHLLRVSNTKALMEMVHRRVPGCILDFFPYYFNGDKRPGPSDDDGFVVREGTFGLTWEDSGIQTEKVVMLLILNIRSWEKQYNMRVLHKGTGLLEFLHRLPLTPGFVDTVIETWGKAEDLGDEPEKDGRAALWERLKLIIFPQLAPMVDQAVEKCKNCKVKTPRFLKHTAHSEGSLAYCALCSFDHFAATETERYRQEKKEIVARHLYLFNFPANFQTLAELVSLTRRSSGRSNPAPVDLSITNPSDLGAVVVSSPQDRSVGPWTLFDISQAVGRIKLPLLLCHRLYTVRLADLQRVLRPDLMDWDPSGKFGSTCRMEGSQPRGAGDHEFFPAKHPNIFRSECRIDPSTKISYRVGFVPNDLKYNDKDCYVRAATWEQARADFAQSKNVLEKKFWRAQYSQW